MINKKIQNFCILNNTLLRVLIFCATLFFAFCLISYHNYLISNPYPLEYREGAIPVSTDILLKGGNPYDLEHQPASMNAYGIGFPLVMWPLTKFFGSSIQLFRAATAFFIFMSCFLVWAVLWKKSVPSRLSVPAVLIFYGSLLYYTNPAAKPDSFALFLFLTSVLLPYLYEFSPASLIFSLIFGTAAFITKPYFVLALPLVGVYLFLFISRKKGLFYILSSFIYVSLIVIILLLLTDCYFQNTVFSHMIKSILGDAGMNYSLLQFMAFVRIFKGLLSLLILVGVINLFKIFKERRVPLSKERIGISSFCFLIMCALVYFKFGRHSGAWMLYLFHLILPFFIIMALDHAHRSKIFPLFIIMALLFDCSYVSFHLLKVQDYKKMSGDLKSWGKIERMIRENNNIYHSPLLAPLMLKHNKPVYDSGHSDQFVFGAKIPTFGLGKNIYDDRISDRFQKFQKDLTSMIEEKNFDLIILDERGVIPVSPDLIDKNYQLKEQVILDVRKTGDLFRLFVWEPK